MNKLVLTLFALSLFVTSSIGQAGTPPSDEFNQMIVKAYRLISDGKYAEAQKLCDQAAILRPLDNRPYALSGLAHFEQWKLEDASALFALASKFSPSNPVLHFFKARADRFRNAPTEGLVSVRKAIELKPDYAEAYLLLGDLLTEQNERKAAFKRGLELDPTIVQSYGNFGMLVQGKYKNEKAAIEVYRTAIEIDPDKMEGRFDLGRLLVQQGRLDEARTVWNERTSDKDNTFPNFITVLERGERLRTAKKAYEAAPDDPETLLAFGFATMDGDQWVVDGRQDKAIIYFRKALSINPGFVKAQHAICKAYVQISDTYKKRNKDLDIELAKLRKLDPKLADDIVEYRRTYSEGGLRTVGPPPPVKKK